MCPRLDWHMPRMCPMQVDMHCMKPQQDRKLPWQKVVTDDQGHETEFLLPSVAIATLVFHPCNWSTLHKRAEAVYKEGQRVYSHPLTCDQAIAAQAVVDGKPEVDGYRNLLVGCNFAKDKSETERTQSMDLHHLKVLNIAMNLWFKRHIARSTWLSIHHMRQTAIRVQSGMPCGNIANTTRA